MKLKNLRTSYLGKTAIYYETIDSTQKEIHRRIKANNIENGTVIFADIQTDGIGTHGRKWYTDEENNIAFSIFIELNCNVNLLNGLTKDIAKIIVDILDSKYKVQLEIKEPNDIYYNCKKVGGILTEIKTNKEIAKQLIIGVGLNTNKNSFPDDISQTATSIIKEFGIKIDTQEFIAEFCNVLEHNIIKNSFMRKE